MDWTTGFSVLPGLIEEDVRPPAPRRADETAGTPSMMPARTAAAGMGRSRAHPPTRGRNARDDVTVLTCGPAETVRIGLEAADGKNLETFSPTTGVSFSNRG
jgi:hypothetical protein